MRSASEDLTRLRAALSDGRLEALCRRRGVSLCVLHGSAVDAEDPGDVDLAIGWINRGGNDLVALVGDLIDVVGDSVDVMDLDRAGPVAAQRALTRGEVLVELIPGTFANRQMRAVREFMDTDWLRRLDLEALAR
ncbi:MAG: hypothetical protein WBG36_01890 [Ornithinimicrobium sp.]